MIDNLQKRDDIRCGTCRDTGFVAVNGRPLKSRESFIEEVGPCPYCLQGKKIEFPPSDRGGPWGKEGFWSRHGPPEFSPQPPPAHLSTAENRAHWHELAGRFGVRVADSLKDVETKEGAMR